VAGELAERSPSLFVAFDLVRLGDEDLSDRPFVERRRKLLETMDGVGSTDERRASVLSPVTAASRPTFALRRRRLIQGERDANRPQRPRH